MSYSRWGWVEVVDKEVVGVSYLFSDSSICNVQSTVKRLVGAVGAMSVGG